MEHRRIGSLEVPVVGLGCNNFGWRIDEKQTRAVVDAAIEAGITFFDTADIYATGKSEEYLGKALGGRRKNVLVASKFGLKFDEHRHGAKPEYVTQACNDSLRRLGTDYIDLYQIHTPDPTTPIHETLQALDQLVKAGKVREIGCSNFDAQQIHQAAAVPEGHAKFVSVQNHFSLFHREPETNGVLEECRLLKLGFIPYFPLANGLLTGKYRRGQPLPEGSRGRDGFGPKVFTEENLAKAEALAEFAQSRGHTLLELAMSWLASHPAVASIIAGAKTPEQVKTNAASVNWKLTESDVAKTDQMILAPV